MSDYRKLSTEEVKALTTINCCANAIRDSVDKLHRRLGQVGMADKLHQASDLVASVVGYLIESAPDENQKSMLLMRMGTLKLQFGHVRKHPDELFMAELPDAQTLLAPALEKCDLDCPFESLDDDGNKQINMAAVKQCEMRRAYERTGIMATGLGQGCPYQMMI